MHGDRITLLATAIVFGTGAFWGLYWIPVRALDGLGLQGAWGTAAITAAAVAVLAPVAMGRRRSFGRADPVALGSIALGGAAFALYSIGLVYGRVAIIILLFFLTPVWSTLIGRYVMGWHASRLRILAIVVGLLGLAVMLGAHGDAPLPRSLAEWMALVAGLLWSVATTGIRARSDVGPFESAFVFAVGGAVAAAVLAPTLTSWPDLPQVPGRALAVAFAGGGLWWGLSIGGLMWATIRLEPARVGLLLMTEVLVGALSAALLAGERLHPLELVGGGLVLAAGVLEIWPVRRDPRTKAR